MKGWLKPKWEFLFGHFIALIKRCINSIKTAWRVEPNIYNVAKYQRRVLLFLPAYALCVLVASGLANGGPNSNNEGVIFFYSIVLPITWVPFTIYILMLLRVLDYGKIGLILMAILVWIPCFGIFILWGIHDQATRAVKKEGYNVGFWGASSSDIDSMKEKNVEL
jgi:hypothetical protein